MNKKYYVSFFLLIISVFPAYLSALEPDFFYIGTISFHDKQGKDAEMVFRTHRRSGEKPKNIFLPHIKVSMGAKEQVYSRDLFAKVYFYDKNKKLIASMNSPTPAERNDGSGLSAMPVFFQKSKRENIYFALPESVVKTSGWHAIVVFGDQHQVVASLYPRRYAHLNELQFPEKNLWKNPQTVERTKAINPLIEHTVKTGLKNYPQITLFLRKPIGASDFSETQGVLAICVLANSVADMKRQLQEAEHKGVLNSTLNFAEKHKLAIICWGSRSLWNPRANWNEMKKQDYHRIDGTFDDVAEAWSKGILSLARRYGIHTKDFLLVGTSGSAQYAARLALRMPQYFLAVHVHIPSSFDKPTMSANKVLWCLTTGEEEAGYDRSLKFLEECRKLKYSIIYKAIPKLGHAGHPVATRLGLAFFEYALEWKNEQSNNMKNPSLSSFLEPAFWGDVYRQQVYSASTPSEELPPALLVPLPTESIARAWSAGAKF